jgi:SAM-dependent methyltransferase
MLSLIPQARVKRILLSSVEVACLERRAREYLARCGLAAAGMTVEPLALSDVSQTYRVCSGNTHLILKVASPQVANLCVRIHEYLERRHIESPAILSSDPERGAILYCDLGRAEAPARPDEAELIAIVRYLARLHDACQMKQEEAHSLFPDLTATGFPSPARLAAEILLTFGGAEDRRGKVLEAAEALAASVANSPMLVISDIKREHFLFRDGHPVLVDLEMASFWDVPIANLATLFSFPGQFSEPLPPSLRATLLAEYVNSRQTASARIDLLRRALDAADFLLRTTFSRAASCGAVETSPMVRSRRLHARSGEWSIEAEVGPAHFRELISTLSQKGRLRVVDIGCGSGAALRDIASGWPQHQLVGLDLNPGGDAPGAIIGTADQLPLASGSAALVICVQLLQYLPEKLNFLKAVYDVLRPGAKAFFAMTEHFATPPGLPSLPEFLSASEPPDVFPSVSTVWVAGRRVTSFVMVRSDDRPLTFRTWFT